MGSEILTLGLKQLLSESEFRFKQIVKDSRLFSRLVESEATQDEKTENWITANLKAIVLEKECPIRFFDQVML